MKGHSHACRHDSMAALPELTERLRRESRRVTGPRQAILDVMRKNPHPLLIKEIHALLGKGDCDLVTVYRSMEMLQKMGMVKRVEFGQGGARFELLAEGDDGHHHHLVCTTCAHVLQLDDCLLEEVEKKIERSSGFKGVTHRLEFFGLCPKCQGR